MTPFRMNWLSKEEPGDKYENIPQPAAGASIYKDGGYVSRKSVSELISLAKSHVLQVKYAPEKTIIRLGGGNDARVLEQFSGGR
jgi:hypothetical protein